jgi:Rhs element Vgr protein
VAVARTIPTSQNPDITTVTIKVDGEELSREIGVEEIIVNKEVNKIPWAKIRIADGDQSKADFEVSNQDLLAPGKEIEIQFGYRSDNKTVYKGIVINHSNYIAPKKSALLIECKDKAVKMTIGRKSKQYNDLSDSDIAEEIINQYGLDKEIENTSITHKDMVQYDLSDWDFIVSRMDLLGALCFVNDGKVTMKKPDLGGSSVLDLLFGATIVEYIAEIDARYQVKGLKATAWDYSGQEVKDVDGNEPSISEETGNLSAADLADVIGLDKFRLIHSGKITEQELQAWADAKLQRQRLAKVRGRVKCQGFPDVLPGHFIKLNGVGERFSGPVFVSGVKHLYKEGDWTTEISFGLSPEWFAESINPYHPQATMGIMPSMQGLMIGIVTDIEDPEGEERVRVKLPSINSDEQGIWARIAMPDAGKERGLFFRPEVDDEVIVGFILNDPRQMVILGMLNSSAKPAPITVTSTNDEKGYVSREKLKLIFNDKEKALKIETPAGKKITISEQDGIISIEDENSNKITMDSSGITIEAASTLTLKGGSSIKIEAPSVSVNGSGTTEIKGGLVKIN